MAGDLTLALRTAHSGLLANQAALDAVARNVANVNTPGYSRKIVNLENHVLAGDGVGVRVGELSRRIDEGLLRSVRIEAGTLSALGVRRDFHGRIQDLFGTPESNTALSHTVARFQASLESLALAPQGGLEQKEAVRRGGDIALQLNALDTGIQDLRREADVGVGRTVQEINEQLSRIADLNTRILHNEASGRGTTDLRDERDTAVDRLAELIDIRVFQRGDGDLVVHTAGGVTLLDKVATTLTHVSAANVAATTTHAEGDFAGIFVGDPERGNDITGVIRSGRLAGLIDLRDRVLPDLQSAVDELAAEIRDVVNRVHNRGVAFPGLQRTTGSRIFVAPSLQTISLAGGDVTLALFDAAGNQAAATTLETVMQSAAFGSGAQPAGGPWTIDEVATSIEDWLRSNGAAAAAVAVDADGRLAIELHSPSLGLAFRDQTATAPGSTAADAVIRFDADGDGAADESVAGFSSFFGLNDFFVDGLADNIFETAVVRSTVGASAATLTFRNAAGVLGAPLAVAAGSSLADIATAINAGVPGLTAAVVPDGSGVRLRIASDDGTSFTVTENVAGGDTLLADLGLHVADAGVARALAVRADIVRSPDRIVRGAVQWDPDLGAAGAYFVSVGDDTAIRTLAKATGAVTAFDTAGGIDATRVGLADYAARIIGHVSAEAELNDSRASFQEGLVQSLRFKSDSVRGVNLDEEMGDLILYQQAYAAAARVITVIRDMFEALERAV
ncbi:MAG: flagellar hook-associated protein FlgK [Rhodospirillales bacterium]